MVLSWGWWMFREALHDVEPHDDWQSAFCRAGWLKNNNYRALWQVGAFILFGTVHSDGRLGHEMHLSEICLKTADSQAKKDMPCSSQRFAGMCWSRHKLDEDNNYQWWILGLWVWHGKICSVITINDSGSPRPNMHAKFRRRWEWCQQFSLITKASFTMSTHQMVKL